MNEGKGVGSREVTQEALEPTSTSRALRNQLKGRRAKAEGQHHVLSPLVWMPKGSKCAISLRGLLIFEIASEVARHLAPICPLTYKER